MVQQPKTKGFARIRAALLEEGAPVESEVRREAEVVRQVRESDMDLEIRPPAAPPTPSAATTALSSPNLVTQDSLDELADDVMMMDSAGSGLGLARNFKRQALKNAKGSLFWDTFPDGSAQRRVTPPPPSFSLARASSLGLSMDDISMDSPSASAGSLQNPFALPAGALTTRSSSSGNGTPLPVASQGSLSNSGNGLGSASGATAPGPPSAAEITRRINSKRRRDDDFDPVSFKRRAVSPGMSVHNSPIMQSPLQRDMAPWGTGGSRPGSVGGGESSSAMAAKSGSGSDNGSGTGSQGGRGGAAKGRVGFQGMVDTNDGITRLSIE